MLEHQGNPDAEAALYLVPTPIGNKDDVTLRALKVLSEVDVVACEDTRTTGRLLSLHNLKVKKLTALHMHNEARAVSSLIDKVIQGQRVAYCSDAGTPGISDPGYSLVREAIERDVKIVPLPGASALITALVASGLPSDRFLFVGFVPAKKGRTTFLDDCLSYTTTIVMYESPFRLRSLIDELAIRCPDRRICIAREISKKFEEFLRGSILQVQQQLMQRSEIKGEVVVILQGAARNEIPVQRS